MSKAAALLESICKNHPFLDGNKRAAFGPAAAFFEINDWNLIVDQKEAEEFMVQVAMGTLKTKDIEAFLRKNGRKAS